MKGLAFLTFLPSSWHNGVDNPRWLMIDYFSTNWTLAQQPDHHAPVHFWGSDSGLVFWTARQNLPKISVLQGNAFNPPFTALNYAKHKHSGSQHSVCMESSPGWWGGGDQAEADEPSRVEAQWAVGKRLQRGEGTTPPRGTNTRTPVQAQARSFLWSKNNLCSPKYVTHAVFEP